MRNTNSNPSILLISFCLGGCVAATSPMDTDTERDASLSDALSMLDAAEDETLRVFTPVPQLHPYGAVDMTGLLGSTTPAASNTAVLGLYLWQHPEGCEQGLMGVPVSEIATLGINIRGPAVDETHDLPPTVGTYTVISHEGRLAPQQSSIGFRYARDGVFVRQSALRRSRLSWTRCSQVAFQSVVGRR
jgi:hypothetical protein